MRKSVKLLILALTVPAALTLLGLRAGLHSVKTTPGDPNNGLIGSVVDKAMKSGTVNGTVTITNSVNGVDQTVTINNKGVNIAQTDDGADSAASASRSETITIEDALAIRTAALRLSLEFDPVLRHQAQIVVRGRGAEQAKLTLSAREIIITPGIDDSVLAATIRLPATFASLDVAVSAGTCSAKVEEVQVAKTFALDINGAECDLTFERLATGTFSSRLNGGSLEMRTERFATGTASSSVKGGEFTWEAETVDFTGPNGPEARLSIKVSAGHSDVHFSDAPYAAIHGRAKVGAVEIVQGDVRKQLTGLNSDTTLPAPEGAPRIEIEVNAGAAEFTIDKPRPVAAQVAPLKN